MDVTRTQALRFRAAQQQLDPAGAAPSGDRSRGDAAVLDLGVQDTGGPDAARWALAVRGCHLGVEDLVLAWTLRGAPHVYRRAEAAEVAAATRPYDEADAAKRVFDAAKPLREAGIPVLEALDTVGRLQREVVVEPTVKGEVSAAVTVRLSAPYLRWCRPCQATHPYEQPFRLAALGVGLELEPGTSPPVLRRLGGWDGPAAEVPGHLDPIRAALHLLGPTTPKLVAGYLDAPVRTVRTRWPEDTVAVRLEGEDREVLTTDVDALRDPPTSTRLHLLGAFDPWLQARDRDLLVPDAGRRKALWPVLGRPGALLRDDEVVGTWRPRSKGATLRLHVERWDGGEGIPDGFEEQAEALAAHRGQRFGGPADG